MAQILPCSLTWSDVQQQHALLLCAQATGPGDLWVCGTQGSRCCAVGGVQPLWGSCLMRHVGRKGRMVPSAAIFGSKLSQWVHANRISSFISAPLHLAFAPQVHTSKTRSLASIDYFHLTSAFLKVEIREVTENTDPLAPISTFLRQNTLVEIYAGQITSITSLHTAPTTSGRLGRIE